MFSGCSKLASIDLSGLDTSSVTDMDSMFSGCSKLASIDLSGLDTSSVTDMDFMFSGCSKLASFSIPATWPVDTEGALPAPTAASGKWFSTKARRWFTNEQIASGRKGIADTYASRDPRSANTVRATARKVSLSVTYSASKARATAANVRVSGAQGAVTYANASAGKVAKRFLVSKSTGKVTVPKGTKAGTYAVTVRATAAGDAGHRAGSATATFDIVVKKAAQPMKLKAVARTAKARALKKKSVTVAAPLRFTTKAAGTVSYKKASGAKCLTVGKKTGKVTVRKGTKKGTYTIKIKVTAKGNSSYKSASKTVKTKIVVK